MILIRLESLFIPATKKPCCRQGFSCASAFSFSSAFWNQMRCRKGFAGSCRSYPSWTDMDFGVWSSLLRQMLHKHTPILTSTHALSDCLCLWLPSTIHVLWSAGFFTFLEVKFYDSVFCSPYSFWGISRKRKRKTPLCYHLWSRTLEPFQPASFYYFIQTVLSFHFLGVWTLLFLISEAPPRMAHFLEGFLANSFWVGQQLCILNRVLRGWFWSDFVITLYNQLVKPQFLATFSLCNSCAQEYYTSGLNIPCMFSINFIAYDFSPDPKLPLVFYSVNRLLAIKCLILDYSACSTKEGRRGETVFKTELYLNCI